MRTTTTAKGIPMNATPSNAQNDALAAYMGHHADVTSTLFRLLDHYRNQAAPAGGLHWGQVGEIAHVRAQLQGISDFVFGEGEQAA